MSPPPADFLASIIASSEDAIISKTLDGVITSWNPAAERLFGYTAKEAVGRHVSMLIPTGQENEEPAIIERIRRGERVEHYETTRRRKSGIIIDVSLSISPIRNRRGTVIGASKIARDITRSKQFEREREAAREAEVRRVEELSQFKTRFINMAAHELRTPLLPMRSGLHVLSASSKDPPTPNQRRVLNLVERNVERLSQLVEDLLLVAREQAGRLGLDMQDFDLALLAKDAVATFQLAAAERRIRLETNLPGTLRLRGDAKRVQAVLTNLLSNAVKFTPPDGQIRVSVTRRDGTAEVRVQDSGIGIPTESVARLFQPFVQVHDNTQYPVEGSGLGLYICRTYVELHGGRVWVESPGAGRGSTFAFVLPINAKKAKRQAARKAT